MKAVILDAETDGLDYNYCWVVVCRDLDTDKVATFRHIHKEENAAQLGLFLSNYDTVIGHNILGFDTGVLERFNVKYPSQVIDTLIVSRLLNYSQEGGHSLERWGKFFKFEKSTFNDFSEWSRELEERCIVDTLLTKTLYNYFKKYLESPRWKKPVELEHKVASLCNQLHTNGFSFNISSALSLREEILLKVNAFKETFNSVFPKKSKLSRVISPKLTQKGTLHAKDFRWVEDSDLTPFTEDCPFSLFSWEEFNPDSPSQVVERLNAAGWKPTEKTKGHIDAERAGDKERLKEFRKTGWRVCEENLATLPDSAPEDARRLAEYKILSSRLSSLDEWINLYKPSTGRIHGVFNGIGSWTHRKSHQKPNMANIPALRNRKGQIQPYGAEFRGLFTASERKVLVGCDAEGVQLRVFAHLTNDKKIIKAIEEGNKDEKTDIHSLNKDILGTICSSREVSKTYIYALFLGAAGGKQAEILSCTRAEAEKGLERILNFYPGWMELKKGRLKKEAKKGYFEGLDGRLVMFPSEHHLLAGHLQNGESVIMKMASVKWHAELKKLGVPFLFVDDVHDEWQTETDAEYAEIVGKVQAQSIYDVGVELGLNCKLAGSYVIGSNWKETH